MKTKTIAMILAMVMMVVGLVGATLAWLTDKTSTITNTFTTSNISVTLEETTGTKYKMIPGYTIDKNPKATVGTGSEECWLFVEVVKSDNFDTYMEYEMADGWTLVDGTTNVYARKVVAKDIGTAYSVLKNDQVTVKESVTKAQMQAADTQKPTLSFTAYASQLHKNATEEFSAAQAWKNVKDSTSSST